MHDISMLTFSVVLTLTIFWCWHAQTVPEWATNYCRCWYICEAIALTARSQ